VTGHAPAATRTRADISLDEHGALMSSAQRSPTMTAGTIVLPRMLLGIRRAQAP
jgi:hypothetical protein